MPAWKLVIINHQKRGKQRQNQKDRSTEGGFDHQDETVNGIGAQRPFACTVFGNQDRPRLSHAQINHRQQQRQQREHGVQKTVFSNRKCIGQIASHQIVNDADQGGTEQGNETSPQKDF